MSGELEVFGVRLRNKSCRIKKREEINMAKCSLQLQNILLSDNFGIEI